MKYVGIDYGSKRVGTAVSNQDGTIAFPRQTFSNDEELLNNLTAMIASERTEHIVVGDTRSHGGRENPVTLEAETFMERIADETKLPVSRAFEAFSSIEASRYAPSGKEHDDAAAAAVILQRFLDMKGTR